MGLIDQDHVPEGFLLFMEVVLQEIYYLGNRMVHPQMIEIHDHPGISIAMKGEILLSILY
jgi:hypothetical protein